jgi:hypothetical protein
MAHQADTRASLKDRHVVVPASGASTDFPKDDMRFMARTGASTTALACPAYTALPVGLKFVIDNSNGSGNFTLTPTAGTAIVANAAEVWACEVTAAGSIYAGQLTAAPTS